MLERAAGHFGPGLPAETVMQRFGEAHPLGRGGTPEEVAGVNDRRELSMAARVIQERINTAHMIAGVTLADPLTAYIDETVEIGNDTKKMIAA